MSSGWIEIVGQGGRTHFVGLSGAKNVSTKWCQIKKVNLSLAEFSHTTVEGLGGQR